MTNMLVRELDLAPRLNTTDGRRLEVIADGLSLFQGAQLAIDTTLVSALRADGTPRPQLWQMRDHERRPGPSWLSWLQKLADVGLRRRHSSLVRWRHPKHGDYASVGGSRLAAPLEKDVGLHRSESLRKFSARAPPLLSLLQVTSRLCTM